MRRGRVGVGLAVRGGGLLQRVGRRAGSRIKRYYLYWHVECFTRLHILLEYL